jgi:hypothetical protein
MSVIKCVGTKKNYEKGKKTTAATTALCQAKDGVVAECRI